MPVGICHDPPASPVAFLRSLSTSLVQLPISQLLVFCTLFYDSYNKLWGPARWLPLRPPAWADDWTRALTASWSVPQQPPQMISSSKTGNDSFNVLSTLASVVSFLCALPRVCRSTYNAGAQGDRHPLSALTAAWPGLSSGTCCTIERKVRLKRNSH